MEGHWLDSIAKIEARRRRLGGRKRTGTHAAMSRLSTGRYLLVCVATRTGGLYVPVSGQRLLLSSVYLGSWCRTHGRSSKNIHSSERLRKHEVPTLRVRVHGSSTTSIMALWCSGPRWKRSLDQAHNLSLSTSIIPSPSHLPTRTASCAS